MPRPAHHTPQWPRPRERQTPGHRQVTTTQHDAPSPSPENRTQGLRTNKVEQHLQRDIGKGSEGREEAGHAQRKVRAALHPYIWEGTALHPPVGQKREDRSLAASVQPPPVPAKMARDVKFDIRAAGAVAVLDGSTAQAGRQVHGRGSKEDGRIKPCTRSLEQHMCLGSELPAADMTCPWWRRAVTGLPSLQCYCYFASVANEETVEMMLSVESTGNAKTWQTAFGGKVFQAMRTKPEQEANLPWTLVEEGAWQ